MSVEEASHGEEVAAAVADDGAVDELLTRYRRSRTTTYLGLAVAIVLLAAIGLLPVPYIRLSPGPMYNTLGSYDGVDLITITGTQTYPTSGELDLMTVTERGGPFGGLTLPEAFLGWFNHDNLVVPVEALYSPQKSSEEAKHENLAAFTSSESSAVAASLSYLKIPVTTSVVVMVVVKDGPSDGKLKNGDIINTVGGKPVTSADQLPSVVRINPPGATVQFGITRDGQPMTVPIVLGKSPKDPALGFAGIQAGNNYSGPFTIKFGLESVGGPSAGLMFSLGIIDKLTPDNLNDGKLVAGTGTMDAMGSVGPIGGMQQKLAAARDRGAALFLVPEKNCPDVRDFASSSLNVAKVKTLTEAVDVLNRWRSGATDLPRC
ncbi:MAG: PDZ domain-containing protein [Actinomycetes bacterium]